MTRKGLAAAAFLSVTAIVAGMAVMGNYDDKASEMMESYLHPGVQDTVKQEAEAPAAKPAACAEIKDALEQPAALNTLYHGAEAIYTDIAMNKSVAAAEEISHAKAKFYDDWVDYNNGRIGLPDFAQSTLTLIDTMKRQENFESVLGRDRTKLCVLKAVEDAAVAVLGSQGSSNDRRLIALRLF